MDIRPDRPYAFSLLKRGDTFTDIEGFARLVLRADGTITGTRHPNEAAWRLNRAQQLEFVSRDGRITTRFDVPFQDPNCNVDAVVGAFIPAEPAPGASPTLHALVPLLTPQEAIAQNKLGILVASNVNYADATLPLLLGSMERAGVPRDRVLVILAQCPNEQDGEVGEVMGWRTLKTFQNSWEYSSMAAASRYPDKMPPTEYLFVLHDTSEVLPDFWEKMHLEFPIQGHIDMVARSYYCTFVAFRQEFLRASGAYWQGLHGMSKNQGRSVEFGRRYRDGAWFKSCLYATDHRVGPSHRSCSGNPALRVTPYADKAARTKRPFDYLGFWKYSRDGQANNYVLEAAPDDSQVNVRPGDLGTTVSRPEPAAPDVAASTKDEVTTAALKLLESAGWKVISKSNSVLVCTSPG